MVSDDIIVVPLEVSVFLDDYLENEISWCPSLFTFTAFALHPQVLPIADTLRHLDIL